MVKKLGSQRTPDRGDVVWLEFHPQAGHEQAGRRPALVLSPRAYNQKVGLMIVCPVTSQEKGYPFEVAVTGAKRATGVVLADQVKSLDWRARKAKVFDHVHDRVVQEVRTKVMTILGADI